MPRIEFSHAALAQLDRMIELYELPADTRRRVAHCVEPLSQFPDSGSPLDGNWEGFRVLLGPWTWLLIIYKHFDDELVGVVSIEDARSGDAATSRR